MSSEYLYKNIEFNFNIAKDIIPIILLKDSILKREKIIENVFLYHILNGGLKSEGNEKYSIINALTDLKEKGIVEQPNLGYYKLTEAYQNKLKLGEDSLIKLPFDKKISEDMEVNIEDLEMELKNLSFEILKTLSLNDRKNIYQSILDKFELKSYQKNNFENKKQIIEKFKFLLKTL